VPTFFATVCLVLEFVDHFLQLNIVALALTTAGLSAVIVRMALTIGDYLHVLAAARTDAVTDALTQIGNRRALMRDLHDVLGARGSEEHLLLLIDLNGFKSYNDRFGHPAGDALLTRLGGRLADALADCGSVYRLGGDEFCAIVRLADVDRASALERTTSSVSEEGDGFAIGASCGWIVLPAEAQTAADALGLVDRRMYQEKASRRTAGAGGHGVLVNVLAARDASLAVHTTHVIDMALAIAARLELALPEAILDKPGPLTDDEWELVRQHTIVGERIVNGAPGLEDVGAAIRATHERWQGGGYPDGLRGEQIPLTARIVAVADAYEAMTSGRRPYRPPRTHEAAVAEIAACSGEQFDPSVVAAFLEAMSERAGEAQTAAAAGGVKSAGSRSTGSQNVASAGMLATSTRSVR
jgi:diguanylate cyclase (GGDEF)-like protein